MFGRSSVPGISTIILSGVKPFSIRKVFLKLTIDLQQSQVPYLHADDITDDVNTFGYLANNI